MTFNRNANIKEAVRRGARAGLFDVSEGVLTEMVDNAPIKLGTLRRQHDLIKHPSQPEVKFVANTPYAEAVHDGAEPHIIRPKNAKALWFAGLTHPVKQVNHPGNKPNPWMVRTITQNLDRMEDFIAERVLKEVERELFGL